jgi:rare lipoprotein A
MRAHCVINIAFKCFFVAGILCSMSSCIYTSKTGLASYYADYYQGRKTANGEIFDHDKFTAAHKKLPFGTKVLITNLSNNKQVMVRINDRGPFVRKRIIDLTKKAARELDLIGPGVAKVKIRYKHF